MAEAATQFQNSWYEGANVYSGLARRDSMVAAAAAIILLGVLFGVPAAAVDVLLICNLCLAGGLALVVRGHEERLRLHELLLRDLVLPRRKPDGDGDHSSGQPSDLGHWS